MPNTIVEHVTCCACYGTGKIPKLVFWERDCRVCEGTGRRPIVMDCRFPEHIKRELRLSATYGLNQRAAFKRLA